MDDLNAFKNAAYHYFLAAGWLDSDQEIIDLQDAGDWEPLSVAIRNIAISIGDRKGYGDEGIGELYEEFINQIEDISGLEFMDPDAEDED